MSSEATYRSKAPKRAYTVVHNKWGTAERLIPETNTLTRAADRKLFCQKVSEETLKLKDTPCQSSTTDYAV